MWDGFQTNEHARVMVLAATNRPWEVDEAILRRLPRSFEVGLPTLEQRVDILKAGGLSTHSCFYSLHLTRRRRDGGILHAMVPYTVRRRSVIADCEA